MVRNQLPAQVVKHWLPSLVFRSHFCTSLCRSFRGVLGSSGTLLLLVRVYDKYVTPSIRMIGWSDETRGLSPSTKNLPLSKRLHAHLQRRSISIPPVSDPSQQTDAGFCSLEIRGGTFQSQLRTSLGHSQGREKQAEGRGEEGQSVIVIPALIILRSRGIGIRKRPQGELSERADMTFKSPLFSVSRLRREDEIGSNGD